MFRSNMCRFHAATARSHVLWQLRASPHCPRYLSLLAEKASVLTPRIIPKGYDDQQLAAFCLTAERKAELQQLIAQEHKNHKQCACGTLSKEAEHFSTKWEIDPEEKTYKLRTLEVICSAVPPKIVETKL